MNVSCPWTLFDDRGKENLDTLINVTGMIFYTHILCNQIVNNKGEY